MRRTPAPTPMPILLPRLRPEDETSLLLLFVGVLEAGIGEKDMGAERSAA